MLWINAEENYFFDKKEYKNRILEAIKIDDDYKKMDIDKVEEQLETVYFNPTEEKINTLIDLKQSENLENITILSSKSASFYGFNEIGFFTEITIYGKYFPFTEEQIKLNFNQDIVLQNKLGLQIKKSEVTMSDMAGSDILKKDIFKMLRLEKLKMMNIAGLFLFGVAGAGKSFFGECFAGETQRRFVVFDLPYFMSLNSPTKKIDKVFDFLLSQKKEKYLLLIDEIEKMFDFEGGNLVATQVFGKLLTRLNDIYSNPLSNITFVATANNISNIMMYNPEFLRKGRFNRLYFLNYPTTESTMSIFELYKNSNKKIVSLSIDENYALYLSKTKTEYDKYFDVLSSDFDNDIDSLKSLFFYDFNIPMVIRIIKNIYSASNIAGLRFIYVPPEIKEFAKDLQFSFSLALLDSEKIITEEKEAKKILNLEDEVRFISQTIIPLQISAKDGVSKQIAQSKTFDKDTEEINLFITI